MVKNSVSTFLASGAETSEITEALRIRVIAIFKNFMILPLFHVNWCVSITQK